METEILNKPYTFSIETISPVAIGDGQTISPLADYIPDGNKILILNQEKFTEALFNNKKIDAYRDGVFNVSIKNKTYFLKDFISKELNVRFGDLIEKEIPSHYVNAPVEIKTVIKNADDPYIPGSSIKGAIKTAILYKWLDGKGKNTLDQIIADTEALYNAHSSDIENMIDLKHRNDKLQGAIRNAKRKFVGRDELNSLTSEIRENTDEIKSIQAKLSPIVARFNKKLEDIVDSLLHVKTAMGGDQFSYLRVSDTLEFNFKLEVDEINRRHLVIPERGIPVLSETINGKSKFTLDLIPRFEHKNLTFLNKSNAVDLLLSHLNDFAFDLMNFEINVIESQARLDKKSTKEILDFYKKHTKELDSIKDAAYLCLGFGKTFFHQSIGLAIAYQDADTFLKYIKIQELGKPKQAFFPITRNFTTSMKPLGWVKLQK